MARQGVAYNNNTQRLERKKLIGKWDWNENEKKAKFSLIESLKINNRWKEKRGNEKLEIAFLLLSRISKHKKEDGKKVEFVRKIDKISIW